MTELSSSQNTPISAHLRGLTSPEEGIRRQAVEHLTRSIETGVSAHAFAEIATLALARLAYGPMPIELERSIARYDADEYLQGKIATYDDALQREIFNTVRMGLSNGWTERSRTLDTSAPRLVRDTVELALKSGSRWGFGFLAWIARAPQLPGSNFSVATKAVLSAQGSMPCEEKHNSAIQEFKMELGLLMASVAFRAPLEVDEVDNAQPTPPSRKLQFASSGPLAMLFSHRSREDLDIERYRLALHTASKERWNFLSSLYRSVESILPSRSQKDGTDL